MIKSLGHEKGSCLLHPELKTAFINIPKVASQSLKDTLRPAGFQYVNIFDYNQQDYRIITILRDPLQRFISGYLENWDRYREQMRKYEYWSMPEGSSRMIQCLLDLQPEFEDEHMIPQYWFIEDIKIDEMVCLERVIYREGFFEQFGVSKLGRSNVTIEHRKENIIRLVTPQVVELVQQVYEQDYVLYQQVC
jgi:hypothetical protein